jgi:hypothetical protein
MRTLSAWQGMATRREATQGGSVMEQTPLSIQPQEILMVKAVEWTY